MFLPPCARISRGSRGAHRKTSQNVLSNGVTTRHLALVTTGCSAHRTCTEVGYETTPGVALEARMTHPSLMLVDSFMKLRLGNAKADFMGGISTALEVIRRETPEQYSNHLYVPFEGISFRTCVRECPTAASRWVTWPPL